MSVLDLCIKIATEFVETGIQLRFTQKKGEEKQEYKECKKKSVPPGISLGSVVNNLPWMICVCVLVVTQLCLILCKSMDFIQPGSSVHGDSPGKNTGVGYHSLLQGIFPTQGPNPGLPHCRWILYCLSHQRMKGTWVWSLVWEDPTCHSANKSCATTTETPALEPVSHTIETTDHSYWSLSFLGPMVCNIRSHQNENPQ